MMGVKVSKGKYTGAAPTRGPGIMPPTPTFLLSKEKKIHQIEKEIKNEIVKRSHHSTCSGSRESHLTLIYREKWQLLNSVFKTNQLPLSKSTTDTTSIFQNISTKTMHDKCLVCTLLM